MRIPDFNEAKTRDKREYKRLDFELDKEVLGKYSGKKYFIRGSTLVFFADNCWFILIDRCILSNKRASVSFVGIWYGLTSL